MGRNTHDSLEVEQISSSHVRIKYTGCIIVEPMHLFTSLNAIAEGYKKEVNRLEVINKLQNENIEDSVRYQEQLDADTLSRKLLSDVQKGSKKGCGDLADAMILHDWIKGATLAEMMQKQYPYRKNNYKKLGYDFKRYGKSKFYDLRNKKNTNRLFELRQQFPDEFSDCTDVEITNWLTKLKEGKLK